MSGALASKPFPIQPRFLSFMRSIMICCPNAQRCRARPGCFACGRRLFKADMDCSDHLDGIRWVDARSLDHLSLFEKLRREECVIV